MSTGQVYSNVDLWRLAVLLRPSGYHGKDVMLGVPWKELQLLLSAFRARFQPPVGTKISCTFQVVCIAVAPASRETPYRRQGKRGRKQRATVTHPPHGSGDSRFHGFFCFCSPPSLISQPASRYVDRKYHTRPFPHLHSFVCQLPHTPWRARRRPALLKFRGLNRDKACFRPRRSLRPG